jgi:hypothetical protein
MEHGRFAPHAASHRTFVLRIVAPTDDIGDRSAPFTPGTVERVDDEEEKVYVDLTKDQIKNSPEWDQSTTGQDDAYRGQLDTYYGDFYR